MARPRKTNSRKPSQKKKDCVTCGDVDFMKNVTKRGRKPKAAAHKTSVTASMTFERNNNVLHFDQLSLTTFPSLPEERFDLVNSCVQKNRSETRLNVVEFNGDIVQQSLPLMMGPMESVFHQQHRIAAGCSVMPSQTTPTGRCSNWDLHEFIECVYRFVVFILHDRTVHTKMTHFFVSVRSLKRRQQQHRFAEWDGKQDCLPSHCNGNAGFNASIGFDWFAQGQYTYSTRSYYAMQYLNNLTHQIISFADHTNDFEYSNIERCCTWCICNVLGRISITHAMWTRCTRRPGRLRVRVLSTSSFMLLLSISTEKLYKKGMLPNKVLNTNINTHQFRISLCHQCYEILYGLPLIWTSNEI